MALPNPALTFAFGPIVAVGAATKAGVLTAVQAAIAALPSNVWQTAAADTADAVNLPGIIITPPAGSPIVAAFAALLGYGDASVTGPLSAQIQTPDSQAADLGWCGFSTQGYTAGTNWYAASPFGAGKTQSKLAAALAWTVIGLPSQVWASASAETLLLGFRYTNDQELSYIYIGALFDPPNLGSAEADERMYGMAVMGKANNLDNNWCNHVGSGSANSFLMHATLGNTNGEYGHTYTLAPGTSTMLPVSRAAYNVGPAMGQTLNFDTACTPIYAFTFPGGTPALSTYIGRLRGIGTYREALARTILLDGVGVEHGQAIAPELSGTQRMAFALVNGF